MQMGANASSTAAKLTDENKSFWAPFAGPALEVMRKESSFKGASQQSVDLKWERSFLTINQNQII